jgi:hypothetical protein
VDKREAAKKGPAYSEKELREMGIVLEGFILGKDLSLN